MLSEYINEAVTVLMVSIGIGITVELMLYGISKAISLLKL